MFIEETFGVTYCEYIVEIIYQLICQQEISSVDTFSTVDSSVYNSKFEVDIETVTNTCTNTPFQVPHFIEDTLSHNSTEYGIL